MLNILAYVNSIGWREIWLIWVNRAGLSRGEKKQEVYESWADQEWKQTANLEKCEFIIGEKKKMSCDATGVTDYTGH